MPAPTFVTAYASSFGDTTSPKTVNPTVNTGDVLVVVGVTEDSSTGIATPTGGGLTYALAQSHTLTNNTAVYAWTTVAGSGQSFTLSASESGTGTAWWGINCLRFSSTNGVGTSTKGNGTGAPSFAITPTQANSVIVLVSGDWNASDGTTRTPRSIGSGSFSEQTYFFDGSHYALYAGHYTDAGAIASKTVGWSAPTGQKWCAIAVEVLGTTASSVAPKPLLAPSVAVHRAANY